jgi:hypothetical protein
MFQKIFKKTLRVTVVQAHSHAVRIRQAFLGRLRFRGFPIFFRIRLPLAQTHWCGIIISADQLENPVFVLEIGAKDLNCINRKFKYKCKSIVHTG